MACELFTVVYVSIGAMLRGVRFSKMGSACDCVHFQIFWWGRDLPVHLQETLLHS